MALVCVSHILVRFCFWFLLGVLSTAVDWRSSSLSIPLPLPSIPVNTLAVDTPIFHNMPRLDESSSSAPRSSSRQSPLRSYVLAVLLLLWILPNLLRSKDYQEELLERSSTTATTDEMQLVLQYVQQLPDYQEWKNTQPAGGV